MQQVQVIPISKIIPNPDNPRTVTDDKFKKLVKSLTDFPEMLEKRPLICVTTASGKFMVLGGNQRLKAAIKAGIKQLPVMLADDWSEEKRQEFVVKDNLNFGDWDWELLKTDWNEGQLIEWGLEMQTEYEMLPFEDDDTKENPYNRQIHSPSYEPTKDIPPGLNELYNIEKYKDLIIEIESSNIDGNIKEFLKIAASRHIVFNYENIAEFYCNTDKDVQLLMEKSALVLIDFNKAIENGFVLLTEQLKNEYTNEYKDT